MDHATIEEQALVERYHRGDLPPDLEMRFEEHFLGCDECQENLALARGLRNSLRRQVAEDATRVGLLTWLARRGRRAQLGLALAAFLLLTLPLVWRTLTPQDSAVGSPTVLLLQSYRGDEPAVLDLGEVAGLDILLAVDAEETHRFESFQLTLETTEGAVLFEEGDLYPNALEVLMLRVPKKVLAPGDYHLRLAGLSQDGPPESLGDFPFRVRAP